jgi:predicted esterase
MKIFSLVFILIFFVSCGESGSKKQNNRNKIAQKKINTSTKKLYESYQAKNKNLSNVVFIALDAHADTKLAISNLRWSAENYGFNLIALKNVENNDPQYQQHIQKGLSQAINDLDIKPTKLFLIGFSGGARMALNYAQNHKADGVIMLGAGPGKQNKEFSFPLAMVSGTQDFNFSEQYYPINSQQVFNPNLMTLHWREKHEWPDSSIIDEAVSFILYASSTISVKNIYRKSQLERAKQAQQENNLFFYFKELELIFKTSTGDIHDKTQQSIKDIRKSGKAIQYFNRFNKSLVNEQKRKQVYIKDLDEKPMDWWKQAIENMDNMIASEDNILADSYARSKAFMGILLYSKTSAAISGRGNAKLLPKYLEIYQLIEPQNPDLFYFKAKYAYVLSDNDGAIENLKQAIKYGFNDDEKLHQSFPQIIISAAKK